MLDRPRLETLSCECYRVVKKATDVLLHHLPQDEQLGSSRLEASSAGLHLLVTDVGTAVRCRMHRPWEKHLSAAIMLAAVAFAVGEFWNAMVGSAIAAVALFVALRPLFRNRRVRK